MKYACIMNAQSPSQPEKFVRKLFQSADIEIGGTRAWDVQVHDERFYENVLAHGTLGLGDAYMAGWWDAGQVDEFIYRLLRADIKGRIPLNFGAWGSYLKTRLSDRQPFQRFEIARKHYTVGNDLFRAMLDKYMVYSSAYWPEAKTLDQAQAAKMDLICRKANLQKDQRVLDIGSGWGGLLKYAAENYEVEGTGVTRSQPQYELSKLLCDEVPVDIFLQDYRKLKGQFDAIFSIGMFEQVGHRNYRQFMGNMRALLKEDGLFILQTIGTNHTDKHRNPWLEKFNSPGGGLPSPEHIAKATEGLFVIEDWHNFGGDYDRTLMVWHNNFEISWPQIKDNYDERFYRMWRYYLMSFAAAFRARKIQLWQLVLSKHGMEGGYRSIR